MRTLLAVFLLAVLISLLLTPLVRDGSHRLGLVDRPDARKVHRVATPRTGGVAVFTAFLVPFALALVWQTQFAVPPMRLDPRLPGFFAGAVLLFVLGLVDDVKTLGPGVKLVGQAMAALLACAGGIGFRRVGAPDVLSIELGMLSLPATVFWFLLVINAINLIDGLDGLATGISMFSALILLGICVSSESFVVAIGFTALAGATLGFLRYNFNPASIFLGDAGSYVLGYCLAGLSVMGARKSEAAVTILIPVIAMGVPVIDAVWAPIRRFIRGRAPFRPDRDHIHHRLLGLGLTHRRAVLVLYAATIAMGVVALALVHARDESAAVLLVLVGVAAFVAIRRLGYLEHMEGKRLVGWLGAVGDELGLRSDRRSFLDCQLAIAEAGSIEELWSGIVAASRRIGLDHCELLLDPEGPTRAAAGGSPGREFRYRGDRELDLESSDPNATMLISLPLGRAEAGLGRLVVGHHGADRMVNPYLLRRVDQLHWSVADAIERLRATVGSPRAATGAPPRRRSEEPSDPRVAALLEA